jgi:hypothetical protein
MFKNFTVEIKRLYKLPSLLRKIQLLVITTTVRLNDEKQKSESLRPKVSVKCIKP